MSDIPSPEADSPDALFGKAAELRATGRFEAAAELYREVAGQRLTVNVAAGLGACLIELGDWDEARQWLTVALAHRPERTDVRRLLANLHAETGEVAAAEREYRAALAQAPGDAATQLGLAGLLLSVGRYAEGWPLMEARAELNPSVVPPVNTSFPEWTGEPLDGRSVLVWYEQGLGDQIQMCRFAALLKARGAGHVALGCRPPLVELIATAPGVDEVIPVPLGGAVSIRRYDLWSRYFSLPHRLGVTLEEVATEPYLSAPDDRRERWRGWSGVGFVWRASPSGFNARNKILPDELAQRLLDLGAKSLHPEDTRVADFADTAAIVEQLDLVISIDTSVAHLAGAMGKPCWTLVPRIHTDWRWLRDRTDSPWYSSMRLYRQTEARDWSRVMDEVAADLAAWKGTRA